MAVARGHMAHEAILHALCIDGKSQVVAVGPDGAPVDEQPACPDCVMGALLALSGDGWQTSFSVVETSAQPAQPPVFFVANQLSQLAWARAPPTSV